MSISTSNQGVKISRLKTTDSEFNETLDSLSAWDRAANTAVEKTVIEIISHIRRSGDDALLELTNRLDRRSCSDITQIGVGQEEMSRALASLDHQTRQALEKSAQRIEDYHQHQLQDSWQYKEPDGTILGQQVMPMQRVGIYVPGGKASYPSSVLMNAIPARVSGVQ